MILQPRWSGKPVARHSWAKSNLRRGITVITVSRRQIRLQRELGELLSAVRSLQPFSDGKLESAKLESIRAGIVSELERYLLPRIGVQRIPMVVAFIGPTGAGKSTVINALAGRLVSKAGVLRPTTKRSTVWTKPSFRPVMEALGDVVEDNHPLLDTVALIDTPDLDSNVQGHYQDAMLAAQSSDGVIFVTTAARYGDALPWKALEDLTRGLSMPVAVLLNRVPSRAGSARNDLLARLRHSGLGQVPVLSISEQRIEDTRGLSRPAVQRLSSLIREWGSDATEHRQRTFGLVCDQLSADLAALIDATQERHRAEASLLQAMKARYDMAQGQIDHLISSAPRRRIQLLRRTNRNDSDLLRMTVIATVDQAAEDTGELWADSGVLVPPEYMRASSETVSSVNRLSSTEPASDWSAAAAADSLRFPSLLAGDPAATIARMERAAETLSVLTWSDA